MLIHFVLPLARAHNCFKCDTIMTSCWIIISLSTPTHKKKKSNSTVAVAVYTP
jgi:hypothetical protein